LPEINISQTRSPAKKQDVEKIKEQEEGMQ
jgi:hypothetical protein